MPQFRNKFGYRDDITMLGSCFADGISSIMKDLYFKVKANPFGTLYNPASIADAIERLGSGKEFTLGDVVETGNNSGLFSSFSHHCDLAEMDSGTFLAKANESLCEAAGHFRKSDVVIVTFGTAFVYTHKDTGKVVANCLKRPAAEFGRRLLDAGEIAEMWGETISRYPDKKWYITVSPVRHLKDGAHGNQISKATLLLAVERICAENSNCEYFPAYEIMNDELRDYRFYAEDLVHPSAVATRYIWEKFRDCAVYEGDFEMMREAEKIRKGVSHRMFMPEHPQSIAHITHFRERERQFIKRISGLK